MVCVHLHLFFERDDHTDIWHRHIEEGGGFPVVADDQTAEKVCHILDGSVVYVSFGAVNVSFLHTSFLTS